MRGVTRREFGALAAGLSSTVLARPSAAQSTEAPIRIGYTLPLSGGLAGNGRPSLLAHRLWLEDVNAKGGLLGRKVELVNYDDQSNPRAESRRSTRSSSTSTRWISSSRAMRPR